MEDTIFTKIIRHEVPAEIIYEDDDTIAFLDIHPNNPGHTLVIPKRPTRNIFTIDDETLAAVMRTVRKIAPAVKDAVGADGVNINSNHESAAGQAVFHLHIHVIPRFAGDGHEPWPHTKPEPHELSEVARRIREKL